MSILCNISKIFEAVIYNRLNVYFVSKDLLSDKQYGFRKGKNTEMAILDLLFKILPAIENKKVAQFASFLTTQHVSIQLVEIFS